MMVRNRVNTGRRALSVFTTSLGSTGIISKKCMNENSVSLIMCEKYVYRIRILK